VAMAPFNFQAHDTYFVVAHLHTVLIAGTVFPVIAGLYYYFPLAVGKQLSDTLGRISFWLVFVGFHATFLPMHLSGLMGLPRRVFTYSSGLGLEGPNLLSTIGAVVLATGFGVVAWDVVRPRSRQSYAPRNPWNAGTIEWLQEIPGLPWGVRTIPLIQRRYPLWEQPGIVEDYDRGRFFLADAEEGRREMLLTSTIDAEPVQCMRIPGPTFITLFAAAAVAGVFIFPTFKLYTLMGVSLLLSLVAVVIWLWTGTGEIPEKGAKDVGLGVTLPLYLSGPRSAGWWAMGITMLAIFSAFVSLVFGFFFYWTLREHFLPSDEAVHGWAWGALGATITAWAATIVAQRTNAAARAHGFYAAAFTGIITSLAAAAALLADPWIAKLDPTTNVYSATIWVLVIWSAIHLVVGALMLLYCIARRVAGRMTATHDMEIANVVLYGHFTLITIVITVAIVAALPFAV
jgi:hypothetical protein